MAPRRIRNGVAGQIQRELTLLPTLEERTAALTTLLQRNGTTFARSQCDVDPVIGTKHVEMVKQALDQHEHTFGYEIAAFPQHGFFSANLVPTMRAAMEAGADYAGGIDPTKIDGGMEASVDAMMQIALDMNKGVDIHLHEPGPSGIAALRRIADTIEREPSLKGRANMSHCYCLMSLWEAEAADSATRMAEMQMSLAHLAAPDQLGASSSDFSTTARMLDDRVQAPIEKSRRSPAPHHPRLPVAMFLRDASDALSSDHWLSPRRPAPGHRQLPDVLPPDSSVSIPRHTC